MRGIKLDWIGRLVRSNATRLEMPFFGTGSDLFLVQDLVASGRQVRLSDSAGPLNEQVHRLDAVSIFAGNLDDCDIGVLFPDVGVFKRCLLELSANRSRRWKLGALCWQKTPRSVWLGGDNAADSSPLQAAALSTLFGKRANTFLRSHDLCFRVRMSELGQVFKTSGIEGLSGDEQVRFARTRLDWQVLADDSILATMKVAEAEIICAEA